jgi:DNA-directed RNA polymerase specialized sigma24 family protein
VRQKRGGGWRRVTLAESASPAQGPDLGIVEVVDALRALSARDARAGRIAEMRLFGGLSHQEIAAELGVDPETVGRHWRFARAKLKTLLEGS